MRIFFPVFFGNLCCLLLLFWQSFYDSIDDEDKAERMVSNRDIPAFVAFWSLTSLLAITERRSQIDNPVMTEASGALLCGKILWMAFFMFYLLVLFRRMKNAFDRVGGGGEENKYNQMRLYIFTTLSTSLLLIG